MRTACQSAEHIGELLAVSGKTVAIAESCTGGKISAAITDIPGSSRYFPGSIVVYSNSAKTKFLHISPDLLARCGAVSSQTAVEMACGIRAEFNSSIGLAVTGIAGPGGGTAEKPVGLVFIALADNECHEAKEFHFTGTREEIRASAAAEALFMLERHIEEHSNT